MKISSEPYDFDRSCAVQGRLAAGRRLGEAQLGDPVGPAGPLESGQRSSSARFTIGCAAMALVALAPHPVGLSCSASAFFSTLPRSRLRRALVGLALAQVLLPAHVVDVDHRAVGVEVDTPVHGLLEEVDVVADHDDAALVRPAGTRAARRPSRRRGGWSARRGAASRRREQDAGQLDAAALAAGERAAAAGRGCGRAAPRFAAIAAASASAA